MDREKIIEDFEHLLNSAKGNYQDFVDLTVDGAEEVLVLLKEFGQLEGWARGAGLTTCRECKFSRKANSAYAELLCVRLEKCVKRDWFCADGEGR